MSLVLELQREALNPTTSVTDLLRKALAVARKLALADFESWVRQELTGYEDSKVPAYRKLSGGVFGKNPYHGWIPYVVEDREFDRMLSSRPNGQPISELEGVLRDSSNGGKLVMSIPGDMQALLLEGQDVCLPLFFCIDRSEIQGTIDHVRTLVLDWTLTLERVGILGSDLTFSSDERSKATEAPTITNFITNNIGSISGSALQQGAIASHQIVSTSAPSVEELRAFAAELRSELDAARLEQEAKDALSADLAALAATLSAKKPNVSIVGEILRSIRAVVEGAGADLLSQALMRKLLSWP